MQLDDDVTLPPDTEIAMADAFLSEHGDDWRFCAQRGSWLRWNGHRWLWDEKRAVFKATKEVVRRVASVTNDPKKLATLGKVSSVERLVACEPRIAVLLTDLDRDPGILNTPGLAVDLDSGLSRENLRKDLCSKCTTEAPTPPGTRSELWSRFLDRVTHGDAELVAYLQRVAGYALTGSVKEHAIFFVYGTGQNGKGVFINALSYAMGDYAAVAAMTTFTEQKHEGHPTDLAKLVGARLAVAQETEEGRAWAEAKLKQLTGGDRLTARFMCRDFFDFDPTFKVLIAGNHKPVLRNVQKAERRRFQIIPFTATIPDEERDPDLLDKLKAEAGTILRWALDGTAEWRRIGLAPPPRVRDATEAYFNAEDGFGEWLTDNFELRLEDPDAWEKNADVWARWVERCKADGEEPGSKKALSKKLEQRGLGVGEKAAGQRVVKGLRIRRGPTD